MILLALDYMHKKGIKHRDLKPANILSHTIFKNGKSIDILQIADFGLSKISRVKSGYTSRGCTTTAYKAPELFDNDNRDYDEKCDIFALGIIFYELFTLDHPFDSSSNGRVTASILRDDPKKLPQNIKEPIRNLILRMLDKNPENRPDTKTILHHESISAAVEAVINELKAFYE
jgi:serine/threonine protein kinase